MLSVVGSKDSKILALISWRNRQLLFKNYNSYIYIIINLKT
jgi:hypothetical protein